MVELSANRDSMGVVAAQATWRGPGGKDPTKALTKTAVVACVPRWKISANHILWLW
jgi:hypothetical protein